jgi:hypothetical protein
MSSINVATSKLRKHPFRIIVSIDYAEDDHRSLLAQWESLDGNCESPCSLVL